MLKPFCMVFNFLPYAPFSNEHLHLYIFLHYSAVEHSSHTAHMHISYDTFTKRAEQQMTNQVRNIANQTSFTHSM